MKENMQNIKTAPTFFIIKNVKKIKKRDINKKRKKRFFTSMVHMACGYIAQRRRKNTSWLHLSFVQYSVSKCHRVCYLAVISLCIMFYFDVNHKFYMLWPSAFFFVGKKILYTCWWRLTTDDCCTLHISVGSYCIKLHVTCVDTDANCWNKIVHMRGSLETAGPESGGPS